MSTSVSQRTLFTAPLQEARDDLWLLIGTTPPPAPLTDDIHLIPYGFFLAELDKLICEGYEFDTMPFIDSRTFPSDDKLEERDSKTLERERKLIAFSASRSCIEFLRYNKFAPDSPRAKQMSEQCFQLAVLHSRIARVLEWVRQRELIAKHKIDLPAPLKLKLSDIQAVDRSAQA